jgi:predicted Zn-dependent protease
MALEQSFDGTILGMGIRVRKLRTAGRRLTAAAVLVMAAWFGIGGAARAQQLPLIRDDEIELLLADYAQPILRSAALPQEGAVQIHVINDKSFNAFVLDAGNIYVHMGALMQAETPNQIIGVIAHEVGHIDGAHIAAMRSRLAREQTRLLLLRLLGIGAAVLSRSASASPS